MKLPKVTPRQRYVLERIKTMCIYGDSSTENFNTIKALTRRGLIDLPEQRRYFEITDLGRAVLEKQN